MSFIIHENKGMQIVFWANIHIEHHLLLLIILKMFWLTESPSAIYLYLLSNTNKWHKNVKIL